MCKLYAKFPKSEMKADSTKTSFQEVCRHSSRALRGSLQCYYERRRHPVKSIQPDRIKHTSDWADGGRQRGAIRFPLHRGNVLSNLIFTRRFTPLLGDFHGRHILDIQHISEESHVVFADSHTTSCHCVCFVPMCEYYFILTHVNCECEALWEMFFFNKILKKAKKKC